MTRLTENDVRELTARLGAFERDLVAVCGLTLLGLAQRTVDVDRALASRAERSDATVLPGAAPATAAVPFAGARVAAVPVSSGEGFIPGFCECVVAILRHLGCDARVTTQPDVRGLQEAAEAGDEVVFVADDFRFIALNIHTGLCVDDDPATADGYVTALAAAAGGLAGRPVLLLGLGPVGRAAGRRLTAMGADLLAVDPDDGAVDEGDGRRAPVRPHRPGGWARALRPALRRGAGGRHRHRRRPASPARSSRRRGCPRRSTPALAPRWGRVTSTSLSRSASPSWRHGRSPDGGAQPRTRTRGGRLWCRPPLVALRGARRRRDVEPCRLPQAVLRLIRTRPTTSSTAPATIPIHGSVVP